MGEITSLNRPKAEEKERTLHDELFDEFEAVAKRLSDMRWRVYALRQIATTPATTAAGVLAQVNVVRLGVEMGEAAFDRDALENALATLERLAGRA